MAKKLLALFCALMMLAALTACGTANQPAEESSAPADTTPAVEDETEEPSVDPETPNAEPEDTQENTQEQDGDSLPPAETEADARMQAYGDLLTDLLENGVLPNHDTDVLPDGAEADVSFALEDFNGDGQSELLVTISSMYTAGNLLEVYDYRDDGLILEMSEYPLVTFFDNGTATAQWSHNQSMSEFWPYTIYVYNAESGVFDPVGSVYAKDQELEESGFPADVDTDGNGRVYYISSTGSGETDVVDDDALNEWYSSYIDTAEEITPEEYTLNAENIAAIFGNA